MVETRTDDSASAQRDRAEALEAAAGAFEGLTPVGGYDLASRLRLWSKATTTETFVTLSREDLIAVGQRITELQEIVRQNALIQNPDEPAMLKAESEVH